MERSLAHCLGNNRTKDVRLKEDAPFASWLLKPPVKRGLEDAGFRMPTAIQASAIPMGRMGLDLLIHSKAGTGKTLIFSTILLETCLDEPGLHSLIVAPTREIAMQIENVLSRIARYCSNYQAVCAIGGTDVAALRLRLQSAKTVVGTPGRIVHLIENGLMKTCDIKLVILDEADQLYNESHRKNLETILNAIKADRQILACSATFCNDLDKELAKIMRNPFFISTKDKIAILIGIKQYIYELPNKKTSLLEMEAKVEALNDIFKRIPFKLCMVFAGSKSRAESYCNYLKKSEWECELISGALHQSKRNEIFKKFCDFKTRILISTDLMARGIDSEHVNLVINLEPPRNMVTYLHRIGRAGRFGSYGIAITMICSEKEKEQFEQILNEIGSNSLNVHPFPKTSIEGEDETFWDPSSFKDESLQQVETSNKVEKYEEEEVHEEITILRAEENKQEFANNKKMTDDGNGIKILCSTDADDSNLSINTKTFCVDSKDSAVNVVVAPVPVPENKENFLLCQPEDTPTSNRSSIQLSANTIDDASSIAADSQFSIQQDLLAPCPSLAMDLPKLCEFEKADVDELHLDNKNDDLCHDDSDIKTDELSLLQSINKPQEIRVHLDNFFDSYLQVETEIEEENSVETLESNETTVGDDFSIEKQDTSMQVCVDSTMTADVDGATINSDVSKIKVKIQNEETITDSQTYFEETVCLTTGSYNADSEPSTNMTKKDGEEQELSSQYFFKNNLKTVDVNENEKEKQEIAEHSEIQNDQEDDQNINDEDAYEENEDEEDVDNESKIHNIWMTEYWKQVNFIESYTKYVLDYSKNCNAD